MSVGGNWCMLLWSGNQNGYCWVNASVEKLWEEAAEVRRLIDGVTSIAMFFGKL